MRIQLSLEFYNLALQIRFSSVVFAQIAIIPA